MTRLVLALALFAAPTAVSAFDSQTPPSASCRDWRECRQLALEAADRRDYEAFHDLAWRTAQVGPQKNPELMYLLARAQCLSGRPHDALIMLTRLAELGVATDAATNDDFKRTRALPEWAELEALMARPGSAAVVATTSPPSATSASSSAVGQGSNAVGQGSKAVGESSKPARASASSTAVRAPDRKATEAKPKSIEQLVRVPGQSFAAAGLAYDAVSRRFVVGDQRARKLMVVGDSADHAVDLVRADSAGFHDISAMEIDGRRGDLWVVTSVSPENDWTIHRMQLLSGRPLKTIRVSADLEPMRLVDVALSPSGAVLVLDAAGDRLFQLRPGATKLEAVPKLTLKGLTSVTATNDESIVYVAHESGVSRVDLKSGSAVRMSAPRGFNLKRIERVRWHENTLVAVQSEETGSRLIVRFKLNTAGRVAAATILEASIPAESGRTFATISADELFYVVAELDGTRSSSQDTPDAAAGEFVIHRIRLN